MIPLKKSYRMSLISAGSILLDSTFKSWYYRQVRPRIVKPRSQRNSIKSQGLIAVFHSFSLICAYLHIERHSSIPLAEVSSICPYCSSFSVKGMEEKVEVLLKCRAEIRIRACLTASRRAID